MQTEETVLAKEAVKLCHFPVILRVEKPKQCRIYIALLLSFILVDIYCARNVKKCTHSMMWYCYTFLFLSVCSLQMTGTLTYSQKIDLLHFVG